MVRLQPPDFIPGYATSQLAKAVIAAEQPEDAATRQRANEKARRKWGSVFSQMLAGSLQVGSRAPVDSVAAWATLEVVSGGFATGEWLADSRES